MTELPVKTFKDAEGRIKRQAARFQIYVYDDESPEGRPLKLGDPIEGGGNAGTLVDIQWRVHLANKKASWYEFAQLDGEHGYAPGHPLRNAAITDPDARQQLIIDPGPRSVDCTTQPQARSFGRDGGDAYAPTFPPPLQPEPIDTLGDMMTDDTRPAARARRPRQLRLVSFDEFGQPRIDDYANNDGWFDDTSDGPVMARLVMYSELVGRIRFVDVEYPAWVIVGYPRYVPEILDMVTIDDVIEDLAIREFADRTDIYGTAGTFDEPQHDPADRPGGAVHWKAGRLEWNPDYRPWFYRDIWPILFRPDEFTYLCNVLEQSNYPHNQSTRGTFDPFKLGVPPQVDWHAVARGVRAAACGGHHSGELFVEALAPALAVLEKPARNVPLRQGRRGRARRRRSPSDLVRRAAANALAELRPRRVRRGPGRRLRGLPRALARRRSRRPPRSRGQGEARATRSRRPSPPLPSASPSEDARGLRDGHRRAPAASTTPASCSSECRARLRRGKHATTPIGPMRQYLFDLLRQPGEENLFRSATSRPAASITCR